MSCGWVATRIWLWLPLKPTSPSRISRQIARQRWIVRNANIVKGEVPVALVVKAKGADVSEEAEAILSRQRSRLRPSAADRLRHQAATQWSAQDRSKSPSARDAGSIRRYR